MASADRMDPPNASIPHDVIFDILSRLSVKILCRFRCVSKSWSALISDPVFQQHHLHRRQHNPQLFISAFEKESKSGRPKTHRHFLFDKESETLDLIAKFRLPEQLDLPRHTVFSYLDLVCTYDRHNVYVFNPAMKKWITLSGNSLPRNRDIDTEYVAIGYVASTSTYKVFRVFKPATCSPNYNIRRKFEVLTLGSNNWRAVDEAPFDGTIDFQSMTATVDGSSYLSWNMHNRYGHDAMVFFNLKEEEWSAVPIPDDTCDPPLCLLEMGGGLCMVCLERDSRMLDLWLLKVPHGDGRTWEKKYSIDIFPIRDMWPFPWVKFLGQDERFWEKECSIDISMADISWPVPLAIGQETKKLMLSPMIHRLPCYDLIDQKMDEIYNGKSHNTICFYVESFKSLEIEGFKHKPVLGGLNKHVQIENGEWRLVMEKKKFNKKPCDQTSGESSKRAGPTKNKFGALAEDKDEGD